MARTLVAHQLQQFSFPDAFADLRREVTGIQNHSPDRQIEAFPHAVQTAEIRLAVMDIARRDMGIEFNQIRCGCLFYLMDFEVSLVGVLNSTTGSTAGRPLFSQ